jgi:hypothetical protein
MIRGWYSKPTIRSWLGNRRTSGTNHLKQLGKLMKKLVVSALLALALTSTVPACASITETAGRAAVTASPTCEEDMPCWDPADCLTIGNRVCGTADDAGTAWKVWERENGPAKLKVDPSRPHRVDYMASTDTYPENMDTYDLALVGTDGRWYVFRATYTD